jgi:prepilin-type N-terminal cleavage/methylation domain-containing protein
MNRVEGSGFRVQGWKLSAVARRRRGVTLLETLVVIAVGTVIVGIAVGLLVTLFQIDKKSRQTRDGMRVQTRLADQFRRDARAALDLLSAQNPDEQSQEVEWFFEFPAGQRVRYGIKDRLVERTDLSGQQVVRRESYRLPHGVTAAIILADKQSPAIASLRIHRRRPEGKSGSFRSFRVEALLGADHRYQGPNTSEEQEP